MSSEQNIMGTMAMRRLVLHMSWPIMLSMLMQAVYNLVDSIFVARISDEAFLALSYAYPIQTLLIAFCVGIGVAFSATLSNRLGQRRMEDANSVVVHGFILFLSCWLLFFLFGLFGTPAFLDSCTDNPTVIGMGITYLRICCCFSFGICIQFPIERTLQATGHPAGFMIVQGSGALINLVLDPIFIFGLDMGVTGAAVATVIGQISGACLGLFLLYRIRNQFRVSFRGFRFHGLLVKEMAAIAIPAILMQSLASIMSLGLNNILRLWSETAVWVLGAYFKIQSFVFMPVYSINNALIAIISYNYGADKKHRAESAIHVGMLMALVISTLGCILLWIAAGPLLTVCFDAGAEALALGVPSLRFTALAFPVAVVSIILSAAFQSLGYSRYSLVISLLRYVILLLPVALVFVWVAPAQVFLSFLITEAATTAVALVMFRIVRRKTLQA